MLTNMAPRSTPRLIVYAGLAAVIVFWGLNAVVMKAAFTDWNPLGFTGLRFLAMVPLAIGIARMRGDSLRIERRDLPTLLVCACCGYGVYQYFYVLGLAHTTAFASALLSSLAPVFTLMLAVALGDERSRTGRWIGAVIALFGVAVFEGAFAGRASIRLGDALTLVGAVIFAGYNVFAGRLLPRYSPTALIAITLTLGAVMIVPGGIWGLAHQDFTRLTPTDWFLMLYSIVFPMVIGFQLWSWGISKIGAGATSIFNFGVPVVAGFAGVAFLSMPVMRYEILGAAICIAGMAAAQFLARFSLTTLWTQLVLPAER
ncbi:DMT family transporter [bacterium]|nr:MAG: DMT family transporter [bacterium]